MNFDNSKTKFNLAKAFAGESQARNRYDFLAEQYQDIGYVAVANMIKEISSQEEAHAKVFYDFILHYSNGKGYANINIDAGYPFKGGDLLENTKNAVDSERQEAEVIYQLFCTEAKEENFNDIALAFSNIAKIENIHKQKFSCLAQHLENGTLYKSDTLKQYVCTNCGYSFNSLEAFKVCPVCKHNQGYVATDCNKQQ